MTRLGEQAELVLAAEPDLICLQEVRPSAAPRWTATLHDHGWAHVEVATPGEATRTRRPLSVLTASRWTLKREEVEGLPWPERVLSVCVAGLELVNMHSPISPSPGLAKVLTHEAVHAHLAGGRGPRALCGDLNTPRKEHPDGRVWTFARSRYGKLRPELGERWDRAELALIRGLEPAGFRDAFRARHGLEVRELSWEWPQWGGGYRLDHLIVSDDVEVPQVQYLHEWRRAGLSDHSPLLARMRWRPDG